jgi:hypothetical protein
MTQPNRNRGIRVHFQHMPENIKKLLRKEQAAYEVETGCHLSLTRAVYRLLEKLEKE